MKTKLEKRISRHRKVRARVKGQADCPRLCVFRSNKNMSAQLIDDVKGVTLASSSDLKLKTEKSKDGFRKINSAAAVGRDIATKAQALKITRVVFDRGGYRYAGRVKAVAEGAREGGLQF